MLGPRRFPVDIVFWRVARCATVTRTLFAALLGACALATAHAAMRSIAPFAGLGLTLDVSVLAATLGGFALGAITGSGGSEHGGVRAARALLVTAAFTLLAAFVRRPLLETIGGLELRLVVAIAAVLFAGLPAVGLGHAFAAAQGAARTGEALRALAGLLLGAGVAAPLVGFVIVPRLGLTLALALVAAVEAVVALASGTRRAPLTTGLGALLILAAAGVLVARPARAAKLGPRMLEHRQGVQAEYRVFDRDGARYLVADGSIQAVMDTLSGECVQRGPAALELLKLFRIGRDSMLVLGLRGGTLPLAFARSGWRVSVVEPDRDAVAVSGIVSYRPAELALAVADPRRFVARDERHYGVIVVDAFAGSVLPYPLTTREFVRTLAPRLTPDGLVVVSVEAHGWGDPLVSALAATLRTAFPHVLALPTSEPQNALGTILLVASRQPIPLTDEQLPDPTVFFQNPDALWVAQQQLHAWLNRYEPPAEGAPVLTDDRNPVEVWADRVNHAARKELHAFFGPHGGSW